MDKNRIVFLEVPESLRGQIESLPHEHEHHHEGGEEHHSGEDNFSIDPAIPIPVEIPPGEEGLNLKELSWEMILAGMIGVIADSPQGDSSEYYRRFVLAVKPGIRGDLTGAAILKAKNGDFDLALEILAALEGLFPGSPGTLLNRALVLEERAAALERSGAEEAAEQGNRDARLAYETVLALDPPLDEGFFNAGFFYLKNRDFRAARQCFSRYLPLAEDSEKKEQAEAILGEIAEKALDDDSFQEAWELIRGGQERAGLEHIRDFLERNPGVWNGWFTLGWALRRLERWEDGAAAFRKALELGGDNSGASNSADIRNELAICLMETEDLQEARKELETALRDDPDNVKIISNLGVLALKSGDDHEAAGFFRTVLELSPDDPLAKEYLSK
jgi:tetratricopeptide (TPR) repeat protein